MDTSKSLLLCTIRVTMVAKWLDKSVHFKELTVMFLLSDFDTKISCV